MLAEPQAVRSVGETADRERAREHWETKDSVQVKPVSQRKIFVQAAALEVQKTFLSSPALRLRFAAYHQGERLGNGQWSAPSGEADPGMRSACLRSGGRGRSPW